MILNVCERDIVWEGNKKNAPFQFKHLIEIFEARNVFAQSSIRTLGGITECRVDF